MEDNKIREKKEIPYFKLGTTPLDIYVKGRKDEREKTIKEILDWLENNKETEKYPTKVLWDFRKRFVIE